ncbi:MAG: ABC transporter ATP-binding protein [Rhodobacteraceae bacterium]|nr:ABC transporter ATP-binding protein [Paracoccaceae bacterium]
MSGGVSQSAEERGTPKRPALRGAHVLVEAVGHTYRRGDGPVLNDVSFQVHPGEVLALIGRSGCGKSTLLHVLAGLARSTNGRVEIDGALVQGPSLRSVMMFQAPSLYPWMTVAQNAALGLRFSRRHAEIAARVPEVLRLVELEAYAGRNVQDLSGGQQQRVALARSLAPKPDLLLLDEPFSALDAFTRRSLQRDVRAIGAELGLTIVLVTHDIAEAVQMADRALFMTAHPGRIAADSEINLGDARDGASPEFRAEVARLNALYAEIAEVEAPSDPIHPIPLATKLKEASS